jgi:hypothetical protein
MGMGHRAGNEFVEKARQHRPRPMRTAALTPLRPEIRIERLAEIELCHTTREWDEVLSEIGRRNRSIGTARALGSVAITLVPATELGCMLEKKYPKTYPDRAKTIGLLDRVRKGFRDYTRDVFNAAYHGKTLEIASRPVLRQDDMLVAGFSNELEDIGGSDFRSSQVECLEEMLKSGGEAALSVPFAAGSVTLARSLGVYDRRYGLDLTGNDVLYQEHDLAVEYLRKEEGLDTRYLEHSRFLPHANIFDLKAHIAAAALRREGELPTEMEFQAARASVSY